MEEESYSSDGECHITGAVKQREPAQIAQKGSSRKASLSEGFQKMHILLETDQTFYKQTAGLGYKERRVAWQV